MILLSRARALLASSASDPALAPAAVSTFVAEQPRFQNIAYPLALPPLFVSAAAIQALRPRIEAYVRLLEKVVNAYRSDAEVRAFFGLDRESERMIAAEGSVPRAIQICRLDGYVGREDGRLHVLENNADCPAGTLFTPRLNRIVRKLVSRHIGSPKPLLPMDDDEPFTRALFNAYQDAYGDAGGTASQPRIVILQARGGANVESHEIALALRAAGSSCDVVDPRELELTSEGLVHEGIRVDLIWNKINMTAWKALLAEAPEVNELFEQTLSRGTAPVLVNAFGARHVAEAKTSLAFLHDARFSAWFTAEERALVSELVPWTAKLVRGESVSFEGTTWPLERLVVERRSDLVLKAQYDIRGDGVTVGRACDSAAWAHALSEAWDTGAVIQAYVAPMRYPVQLMREGAAPEEMNTSLDCFVFGGTLVGLGAKASVRDKVNLFQGGSKLAVIPLEDEA